MEAPGVACGGAAAGATMSCMTVTLTVEGGLLIAQLARPHGNAINEELVEELIVACDRAEGDPAIRGVLLSASGKLFCPGLDLVELRRLDRPAMERFMGRFGECVLRLFALGKPMVAALHGHAVAGGCVLALTADWRVLRHGAMIGLNEIRVGVPLPYGVALILRESVAPARREEVALFGRNYVDDEAVATGLAHEVRDAEGFEEHCRARLGELADKDSRAFALTKRYLRAATIERVRAGGGRFAGEFLDAWFSPDTRARIADLVRNLKPDR
jgi:Delta3-Delta2-enoyl-CoA isomerase